MLLPAEIESKLTIPLMRAMVARKLIKEHSFTQEEAARAIGVTQAAISNYLRGVRGLAVNWESLEEINKGVEDVVSLILDKSPQTEVAKKLNEIVTGIRRRKILCDIHKRIEPDVDVNSCRICEE